MWQGSMAEKSSKKLYNVDETGKVNIINVLSEDFVQLGKYVPVTRDIKPAKKPIKQISVSDTHTFSVYDYDYLSRVSANKKDFYLSAKKSIFKILKSFFSKLIQPKIEQKIKSE